MIHFQTDCSHVEVQPWDILSIFCQYWLFASNTTQEGLIEYSQMKPDMCLTDEMFEMRYHVHQTFYALQESRM